MVARMMEISYRRFDGTIPDWGQAICTQAGIARRENSTVRAWKEGRSTVAGTVLMAAADVIEITVDELRELAAQELGRKHSSPVRELREQVRDLKEALGAIADRLAENSSDLAVRIMETSSRVTRVEDVLMSKPWDDAGDADPEVEADGTGG